FMAPLQYSYGTGNGGATNIAVADINGDGLLDVALGSDPESAIWYFIATGAPGWTGFSQQGTLAGGSDPIALAFADMNGDAELDLVAVDQTFGGSMLTWLAHLGEAFTPSALTPAAFAKSANYGDFDSDGLTDLVFASSALKVSLGRTIVASPAT